MNRTSKSDLLVEIPVKTFLKATFHYSLIFAILEN